MSDLKRAMRIYLKLASNIIIIICAAFMLIGFSLGVLLDPAKKGSTDYGSMLFSMYTLHIGTALIGINVGLITGTNKYFASLPFAKKLYIDVPLLCGSMICAVYDLIISFCACYRGGTELMSDILVFTALGSMMSMIVTAVSGKKKFMILSGLMMCSMFFFMMLSKTGVIDNGLDLPLWAAFIIFAGVYAAAILISYLLLIWWWKTSNRADAQYQTINNSISA